MPYIAAATFGICHEMDAVFWKEWELFRLPGSVTWFVALHLFVVALLLAGFAAVLLTRPGGWWASICLGSATYAGGVVHLFILLAGDRRFSTVFSTGLIVAMTVSGAALILVAAWFPPDRATRSPVYRGSPGQPPAPQT